MDEWDKIIETQKHNTEILNAICHPYTPAELQEIAKNEGWV